ncbi:carboxypeptidase-like regulatory domain-containing protein [Paludibaculum fermentans]|uniref:Carboxypeptidase regulatory-like domain-containing protein n=1 Tax=Paludibaculum fermentans TaxID=1473598 RepID=A0A7S7NR06_PALFE|nr:carboxypeptidase-like regulatory domain-containing protein [Paludibaculum fermentans]QOY88106.1 carboxypeptidase regulatory-like domain-containing protein [Paludibaculum fermentans]
MLVILGAVGSAGQVERNSSIAGRVLNETTGAPVRRALVSIVMEGRENVRGTAPTDGEGQFLLRALPPGRYFIGASKNGYGPVDYGARKPGGPGQVISIGANENKSGLIIRMPQLSAITGSVTGVGGGPATGSYVQAFRRSFPRGKPEWVYAGGANADDRGEYRIFHLPPGQYVVAARQNQFLPPQVMRPGEPGEPEPRAMPALTYHPSSVIEEEAGAVDLKPGAEMTDVDIALQEMAPVRLSVRVQAPPEVEASHSEMNGGGPGPRMYLPVWLQRVGGSTGNQAQALSASSEQRYQAQALLPGRYIVSSMTEAEGKKYSARQEITISGGAVEVTLTLTPSIYLSGHVHLVGPNAGPLSNMTVGLVSGENAPMGVENAKVEPDGSYVLKGVPPGLWDIVVEPIPKGGYLKSMMLGKMDVLTKDMFITAETRDPLDIVVSTRGADLHGHVEEGFATTILAAPQGELAHVLSFYAASGVDENGDFDFRALTPGSYKIYAFEEMAPQAWLDPEFLKNYPDSGTSVELQEGRAPDLKVKAIPGSGGARKGP